MADKHQMAQKKVIGVDTASAYRKSIATGKGLVGSGSNKKVRSLSPATIQQRRQKLADYDALMTERGKTRTCKWAKQLQTITNAIKEDTTKLVATTEAIDARTHAMDEKVDNLRKDVQDYAEKVQVNTQPSPNMLRIVTEMTGPSVPVKILNAILYSKGMRCPGSKQDKAAFLGESFEGKEQDLLNLINQNKNLHMSGMPVTEREKKRMEKKSQGSEASEAAPKRKRSARPARFDSATKRQLETKVRERNEVMERKHQEHKELEQARKTREQARRTREQEKAREPRALQITDLGTGEDLQSVSQSESESDEERGKAAGDISIQMMQSRPPKMPRSDLDLGSSEDSLKRTGEKIILPTTPDAL